MFFSPLLYTDTVMAERSASFQSQVTVHGDATLQGGFHVDASALYAQSPAPLGQRYAAFASLPSSPSMGGPSLPLAEGAYDGARPNKRSRKDKRDANPVGRIQGACTRCKRLKASRSCPLSVMSISKD